MVGLNPGRRGERVEGGTQVERLRRQEIGRRLRRALVLGVMTSALTLGATGVAWSLNNDGGVLLLNMETLDDLAGGNYCEQFTLTDPLAPRLRLPADGRPRLIMAYAAFPPDSVGWIAGLTFGIEYSSTVTVHSHGACNRLGLVLPEHGFPKSHSGVAVVIDPVSLGNIIPIYWFVVSSSGPATFSLTPHPNPRHGGSFGTGEQVPTVTPICGYGSIGFDLEGSVPLAGPIERRGACCLDYCRKLGPTDCDWFGGTFLGEDATCDTSPCGPEARVGACCFGTTCEVYTALECIQLGGKFLGEGSECSADSCRDGGP